MLYNMSTPRAGVMLKYINEQKEPEYLCVFQQSSKFWGLPKGRIKMFESYIEGACRELYEETGVNILPEELSNSEYHHIKRGGHHHFYFVKNINKKPTIYIDNYEIIDYKWMTIRELSMKRVSYFTEQMIKKILNITKNEYFINKDVY